MSVRHVDLVAGFECCRSDLVALAYRMLGDMARAEDMVQEAWLRWSTHGETVESPRAFLITVVTRLCLNELDTPRLRREERRADRLPEPVAIDDTSLQRFEQIDQVSMALLFCLQRLKPAERAVLLLHDVFEFDHAAIGALVGKSASACRKLLERARQSIAEERRTIAVSQEEHQRLLRAFLAAASAGDSAALIALLSDDVVMVCDGGPDAAPDDHGLRNMSRPLRGSARIAAFVTHATRQNGGALRAEERVLNGRPAVVFFGGERPFAALLIAVTDGKIRRIFFHADTSRFRYLGDSPRSSM